jgi:hypothetical protein
MQSIDDIRQVSWTPKLAHRPGKERYLPLAECADRDDRPEVSCPARRPGLVRRNRRPSSELASRRTGRRRIPRRATAPDVAKHADEIGMTSLATTTIGPATKQQAGCRIAEQAFAYTKPSADPQPDPRDTSTRKPEWKAIRTELENMTVPVRTAYWARTVDLLLPDPEDPRRPGTPVTMTAEGFAGEERRLDHLAWEGNYADRTLNRLRTHLGYIIFSFTVGDSFQQTRERLRLELGFELTPEQRTALAELDSQPINHLRLVDIYPNPDTD